MRRDQLVHLGPLAQLAPLGTEVRRFGIIWKSCSMPSVSDGFIFEAAAIGALPMWIKSPVGDLAWKRVR